jgi:hypothetical protein
MDEEPETYDWSAALFEPRTDLTAAHFEAIGRLAVHFNTIEELLDGFKRWFLECREPTVAQSLIHGTFGTKAKELAELIDVLALKYESTKPQAALARASIKEAEKLGERRNKLIHSTIDVDPKTESTGLVYRTEPVDIDLQRIKALIESVDVLHDKILTRCGDFLVAVKTTRDPQWSKRGPLSRRLYEKPADPKRG